MKRHRGFTIVELMIVIVVIAILATITLVAYGGWRKSVANTEVTSDLTQAANLFKNYFNFNGTYPTSLYSNQLADNGKPAFRSSTNVTIGVHTNATTLPHYSGLSTDQNTRLFLDTCNRVMPVKSSDGTTTYHNNCSTLLILGILGITIGGTKQANLSNTIQSNFDSTIDCTTPLLSPSCDNSTPSGDYLAQVRAAATNIKSQFIAQGGTFPVNVSVLYFSPSLPAPDSTVTYTPATTFCLDGTSIPYPTIVYRVSYTAPKTITPGTCVLGTDY